MSSRLDRKLAARDFHSARERIKQAVGLAYPAVELYCRVCRCDVADLSLQEALRAARVYYHPSDSVRHPRTPAAMEQRAALLRQVASTLCRGEFEQPGATSEQHERIVRDLTAARGHVNHALHWQAIVAQQEGA